LKNGVELKVRMTDVCFLFQIHLKLSLIVSTSYDQIRIKVLTGQSVQSIFKKKMFGK
jgi:hypothetical protein